MTPPSIRAVSGLILNVVDAIGDSEFAPRLLSALNRAVGADWCEIHEAKTDGVAVIASANLRSRQNPVWRWRVFEDAEEPRPRLSVHDLHAGDAGQYIAICGHRAGANICLGVGRWAQRPRLTDADERTLEAVADLLIAVIAKHVEMFRGRHSICEALSSLPQEYHGCLVEATDLSNRQAEVCARILYGLSASSIGSDLGISEESVSTHRKRAYQRLRIGSRRELLMLYLAQWSDTQANRGALPIATAAVGYAGT